MFIVTTVDNKVFVEGADSIENWNDLPKDIVIEKISITDGRHVIETLEGFDFYVVCQEGTLRVAVTMGAKFSYKQSPQHPTAQVLYGIKSTKPEQQRIREIFNDVRAEPMRLYTKEFVKSNLYHLKAYRDLEEEFRVKLITMVDKAQLSEVVKVTLSITKENLGEDSCNQGKEFLREGRSKIDFELTDGRIREYFIPNGCKSDSN